MSVLGEVLVGLQRRCGMIRRRSWLLGVLGLLIVLHFCLATEEGNGGILQLQNIKSLIGEIPGQDNEQEGVENFIDAFLNEDPVDSDGEGKYHSDQTNQSEEKINQTKGNKFIPIRTGQELKDPSKILYKKDTVRNVEWTEEMRKARQIVMAERRKTASAACAALDDMFEPGLMTIAERWYWVRPHHLVMCPVFKSASTTWSKNMLILGNQTLVDMSLHGKARELFPAPKNLKEAMDILDYSTNMIIVRHPLERLLSAYRDKMFRVRHINDQFHKLQKFIVKTYPDPNPSPFTPPTTVVSGKTITRPTFNQFLLKVKDDLTKHWTTRGKVHVNLHWRPIFSTCLPCTVEFDLIGKVESLDLDNEFIIHELGLENVLVNAQTHASNFDQFNGTSEAVKEYFRLVPRSLLQSIVNMLKPDFEIFGYSPDEYLELAVPNL